MSDVTFVRPTRSPVPNWKQLDKLPIKLLSHWHRRMFKLRVGRYICTSDTESSCTKLKAAWHFVSSPCFENKKHLFDCNKHLGLMCSKGTSDNVELLIKSVCAVVYFWELTHDGNNIELSIDQDMKNWLAAKSNMDISYKYPRWSHVQLMMVLSDPSSPPLLIRNIMIQFISGYMGR